MGEARFCGGRNAAALIRYPFGLVNSDFFKAMRSRRVARAARVVIGMRRVRLVYVTVSSAVSVCVYTHGFRIIFYFSAFLVDL